MLSKSIEPNSVPPKLNSITLICPAGLIKMLFNSNTITGMERFYRSNLINSITGFKSLNLLGSSNKEGISNLAIFSQVMHLGADPALLGILFRPVIEGMNSLQNIEETGFFTLNHILPTFIDKAHWTSAKWSLSEFEGVGLTEEYLENFEAPFVKESQLKIGLSFQEKHFLPINGTTLVVGKIELLQIPDNALASDGFVNLQIAESVAGIGLDGYFDGKSVSRYAYAKAGKKPEII
jgi:flavin reductase (DIM6/NTAB) family NADH-FMN oxidoreductase RutF